MRHGWVRANSATMRTRGGRDEGGLDRYATIASFSQNFRQRIRNRSWEVQMITLQQEARYRGLSSFPYFLLKPASLSFSRS